MRTIYKYPIEITDFQRIEVVFGAEMLHVGLDPAGMPCVWMEVESGNTDREELHVFVVGTGNPLPDRARQHWGSFIQGPFVWHIYTP